VLKKSFLGDDQEFSRPLMRFTRGDMGPHPFTQKRPRTFVAALQSFAAVIEGFSHFVTSMTAPIASGWSDCRVGLASTGKRRLCTAHTHSRRQRAARNRMTDSRRLPKI
jgi:hypothetical protein